MRVLIIDDESDVCYLLSSILKRKHIGSKTAGSLKEADKVLMENGPLPLIFLDNHLPDGRGIEYISVLKARYPGIKIAMITAHDTLADRQKAKVEGADYFIGKPFTKEKIFAALEVMNPGKA
jgi:two-component system, OmpR family, response regulator